MKRLLDPARHVKTHLVRYFGITKHIPINFRRRDPATLARDVDYALQVARNYLSQLSNAGFRLPGSKILELGPGSDFGPQLILAGSGAEMSVADRFLSPWDDRYHPQFYRMLRARWEGPTAALDAVIAAGRYPESALRQFPHSAEDLGNIPADSFDCVLSNAVLEHVQDLRTVAENLARVTKSPGLNLHQVDFRDHRDFDRPLEFLLLSLREQNDLFSRQHGETGNRLRLSESIALFQDAGFLSVSVDNRTLADEAYFRQFMPRLLQSRSPYRDWPPNDLRVTGARLVLRK